MTDITLTPDCLQSSITDLKSVGIEFLMYMSRTVDRHINNLDAGP